MFASSQTSASWGCRSGSWNVGRAPPSASWSSGREPVQSDPWWDHRWDIEWSVFLPQWGPQTVHYEKCDGRVAAEWGHKTPNHAELEGQWTFEVAGWGAPKSAPQAASKWGEPHGPQAVFGSGDSRLRQGDRLPSVGSKGHDEGSCKRCAFFPKGRCKNGEDCTHCHFEHPKPLRSRRRKRCGKVEEDDAWGGDATTQTGRMIRSTSHAEECKKDEGSDDASTQAGTTLASHSFAAESGGKATQPDDEQYNEALDEDADLSDVESLPSSGAVGSDSGEEELEIQEITSRSETPSQIASDVSASCLIQELAGIEGAMARPAVAQVADSCGKSESVLVSADSWAARQRLRQMDRERNGASFVAIDSVDFAPSSPQHDKSGATPQQDKSGATPQLDKSVAKVFESSAGSWEAQQRLRRAKPEKSRGAQTSPEDIARKAKGLLNKLTQERFEPLCQQILALPVHTAEQLAALVAEIFDKATTEKCFLTLYTELCARLDAHLAAEGSCVGGKVFRKALVTECQASFERNLQQPLDPKTLVDLTYEERYEEEVKHKTRTLGNMRFIGELLICKLLAGKILFFIVNEMLDTNSEASLESLVELLTIVSPALERKGTIYEAPLRETFGSLRQKSKDQKLSMRIRCKINDLLDLRSTGWTGKAVEVAGGKTPKTAVGVSLKR